MTRSKTSVLSATLIGGVVACALSPAAFAYDSHDFTTTASLAGTTAYIVGRKHHDNFAEAHDFAKSQAVALQRESATGGGENIDSLADLLGRPNHHAFGRWMQQHYAQLYADPNTQVNLVDRIVSLRG